MRKYVLGLLFFILFIPAGLEARKYDIKGQVLSHYGEYLKSAELKLMNSSGVNIASTKAGKKGRFKFKRIPSGRYTLQCFHSNEGLHEEIISVFGDDLDLKLQYVSFSSGNIKNIEQKSEGQTIRGRTDAWAQKVTRNAKEREPFLFMPKDEFETTSEFNKRVVDRNRLWNLVEQELLNEEKAKEKEEERLVQEKAREKKRQKELKIAQSLDRFDGKVLRLGQYNADNEVFTDLDIEIPLVENIKKTMRFGYVLKWDAKNLSRSFYQYQYSHTGRMLNIYGTLDGATKLDEKDIIAKLDYDKNFLTIGALLGPTKDVVRVDIQYLNLEISTIDTVGSDIVNIKKFSIPRNLARDYKKNYKNALVSGYKRLKDDLANYEYLNMYTTHPITGSKFIIGPQKDIDLAPVLVEKTSLVPPDLNMRVAFIESNGNGFLDAEENGKIKVSISNNGKGSAMGVFVDLQTDEINKNISSEKSKVIGQIGPGQTKTVEFEIKALKSVARRLNSFTINATESYGFPPDPAQIKFETFPFIPPKLELVDFGVNTPNQGNEIRPQTTTEVQVRVQNRGQGTAEDVKFTINLPTGVYFTPDSKKDYSFSSLKPGEFKDLEFSFNTAKTVETLIDITIGFLEESYNGQFALDLEVEKPQQTIQQLVISGQEMGTITFDDVATISVDIEKDIPSTGRNGEDDLAVVFGIESYKNVPGVSFAKRDAEWMKKYFENVLGIPTKQIYYKTNSDVGQAEFSKVFSKDGWLDKRVKKGKSNLFVYYAGHGAPDLKKNKAYLIPYDGDPNYASQTGYEIDAIYKQLSEINAASVTVFLDACFSGANRDNEMLIADARPVFMEVDEAAVRDVTVFSASGGKEISSAWPEKKHGLFSYYLMKGMRGDADSDKDNKITIGELGDYVKENVSYMAGMLDREQTPGLETRDIDKILISY